MLNKGAILLNMLSSESIPRSVYLSNILTAKLGWIHSDIEIIY